GAVKDLARIGADAIIDDDPKHVDHAARQGRIGIRISTYRGGGARAEELEAIYTRLSARKGILGRIGGALGLK
ncbi:MAG: hypothetical protein JNK11_03290, partial [Alphaproteobacteria bacterium]|nr:hypothetical protein [Alphaproteobacteria bacterium]